MKTYTIASEQDVKDFFQSMYTDFNLLLDLDLPFADYTNEKDVPCFTKEEADYLEQTMAECFKWCSDNSIDVYTLGCDVQHAEFVKRGFYPPEMLLETN